MAVLTCDQVAVMLQGFQVDAQYAARQLSRGEVGRAVDAVLRLVDSLQAELADLAQRDNPERIAADAAVQADLDAALDAWLGSKEL